jgi:hypothetical protein
MPPRKNLLGQLDVGRQHAAKADQLSTVAGASGLPATASSITAATPTASRGQAFAL